MAGNDRLRFWEQDYATTTLDVKEAEGVIKEAHDVLDKLKALLAEKNKAYGNSALSDVNLFCNLTSIQLLEGSPFGGSYMFLMKTFGMLNLAKAKAIN